MTIRIDASRSPSVGSPFSTSSSVMICRSVACTGGQRAADHAGRRSPPAAGRSGARDAASPASMPAHAIRHSLMRMAGDERFKVVIAGGGVAGLEGALALADLAADRVAITLVAPNPEFVYRPMSVGAPFAFAAPQRLAVAGLAADVGAELLVETFAWVDPAARIAHTEEGSALTYDALLLALGARVRA